MPLLTTISRAPCSTADGIQKSSTGPGSLSAGGHHHHHELGIRAIPLEVLTDAAACQAEQ
jgi:hypothetical protein